LREIGLTTFGVAPGAPGMAGVVHEIRLVGDAIGRADRALVLAKEMEARLAALRVLTSSRKRARACLLVWTDPIIAAGEGSFLDDLLDAAGADNACAIERHLSVAGAEYPRLSREDLLLARPEILLLAMHEASAAPFEGWGSSIPAVREGNVLALDPDLYLRPSPALAAAAESLAAILQARRAPAQAGDRP
jgi:iron complex transport system substrate-binding protein